MLAHVKVILLPSSYILGQNYWTSRPCPSYVTRTPPIWDNGLGFMSTEGTTRVLSCNALMILPPLACSFTTFICLSQCNVLQLATILDALGNGKTQWKKCLVSFMRSNSFILLEARKKTVIGRKSISFMGNKHPWWGPVPMDTASLTIPLS